MLGEQPSAMSTDGFAFAPAAILNAPTGASRPAMATHDDASNAFFTTWLDPSMTSSCAMWEPHEHGLQAAQERKLDYHVQQAVVAGAERVLDIGCGWGSGLARLTSVHSVSKAVGLTVSPSQASWIRRLADPRIEVHVGGWADHAPEAAYDGILSIGALEHIARPEYDGEARVAAYRKFFMRCHELLRPGGHLSLETIALGRGKYLPDTPLAEMFPESRLPRLSEIAEGFDQVFEVQVLRNDRTHYERTVKSWLQALEANWHVAVAGASEVTAERYRRYLGFTAIGFASGLFDLYRITLRARGRRSG
jgi:cyclopropane-fatty-acyl-phospholipid synthase